VVLEIKNPLYDDDELMMMMLMMIKK